MYLDPPPGVYVHTELDGHRVRFPHEPRSFVRPGIFVAIAIWAVVVLIVGPTLAMLPSWIRDPLLAVAIAVALGGFTMPLIAGWLGIQVNRSTVRELLLTPHQLHLTGVDGSPLGRWTVHDLQDVWASRDQVSPIVAVQTRDGEVRALRVGEVETARWMVDLLAAWRAERATEPTEQAERLRQAMRERVQTG